MSSKQLINSVDTTVGETLSGLCCAYPKLEHHQTKNVVLIANVSFFYPKVRRRQLSM